VLFRVEDPKADKSGAGNSSLSIGSSASVISLSACPTTGGIGSEIITSTTLVCSTAISAGISSMGTGFAGSCISISVAVLSSAGIGKGSCLEITSSLLLLL